MTRTLGANSPLLLDEPRAAWLVTTGHVQVFALDATGVRHPLFAVESGGLLLGPPAGLPLQLLAVGIAEGTSVRALDDPTGLLEAWLEALAGAAGTVAPADSVRLEPETSLAAGQAAWSSGLVWLAPAQGLRPFGEDGGDCDALPLPARAWVEATAATTVRQVEEAADPDGVDVFQRAALTVVARRLDRADADAVERIELRLAHQDELRASAYSELAAVLQPSAAPVATADASGLVGAFQAVCAAIDVPFAAPPPTLGDFEDPVDAMARAAGVRVRRIVLPARWWRQDTGPLVATRDDGRVVALLPAGPSAYDLVADGRRTRVDSELASTLEPEAFAVYRPLPHGIVTIRDVRRFLIEPSRSDLVRVAGYGTAAALLSLITPLVAAAIFSRIVPGREQANLVWLSVLLGIAAFSSFGFVYVQHVAILRLEGRSSTDLQSALWDRLLDLPTPFFRRYSAGGLTMRLLGIPQIRTLLIAALVTASIAVPVGIANLVLAFVLEPRLAAFGLVAIVVVAGATILLARRQVRGQRIVQRRTQAVFATAIELVEGIGKLRTADAEPRGFARWASQFAALQRASGETEVAFAGMTALAAGTTAFATVLVFMGAATLGPGHLSGAEFIAFNTAFIQALAAVLALSMIATFVAQAIPVYENIRPILEEPREAQEVRTDPGELRGAVEVSNVSLRYTADGPLVLDSLSFAVEPGQLVAIVGPSGAGKSSLLRLLLGFEHPEVGSVRYDGEDLRSLDPRAVRRQMGVVLQTARLLPGDIRRNIVGTRPLSLDDAWNAAEIAGIADDIRAMPMGMKTHVSESAATFSGGQRQRLLIARGVAGRPRILLFDEATSALDNRTQAQVSEAIARLRATRIVIAHRLSTVRDCDRILVMEDGRLVQDGTFDELLAAEGPFSRLARRQLV